ncbi:probable protein phosphatase 2C T23F11.1 [Drosophila eugracilis]|uniref:probable protein phosphatase 2C T23F11.1 n=1 Tax=Drosophila eugracilis TaxID=29029 RepID=UPI0007E5F91B|nr:probable protein phosphatase 2C T23F11.1 [Drosophila eugracilis]XP_017066300.1 probable protein phosphatase 2C T23F11.1 [Drosophila eugracilis]
MGQTLSEPVVTKDTARNENASYVVGSSAMQGWRVEMEDAHTHILSLPEDPQAAFFGVYDGHGGAQVAKCAAKHLHKFVTERPEYHTNNVAVALKRGFLDFDREMLHNGSFGEQSAGSTAVVVLIRERRLYCANAGDSRAIACVAGVVVPLSSDHKPNNAGETSRILAGGGWVEFNRVNGNLALSRALGDFIYKKNTHKSPEDQIVTACPDVEIRDINEDWEFVLLACDGIWDVMTSATACQFVRLRISQGVQPETICEDLMNHCLATDGQNCGLGGDNMTVILVCLLHNKSYEDLVLRCGGSHMAPLESVGDIKDQPALKVVTPFTQGGGSDTTASRLGFGLGLAESEPPREN